MFWPITIFHLIFQSFERHLKGRPHAELGEILGDQHEMIASLLRQQAKLVERRKAIVTEKTAKFKNKNRNNREIKMYVSNMVLLSDIS